MYMVQASHTGHSNCGSMLPIVCLYHLMVASIPSYVADFDCRKGAITEKWEKGKAEYTIYNVVSAWIRGYVSVYLQLSP